MKISDIKSESSSDKLIELKTLFDNYYTDLVLFSTIYTQNKDVSEDLVQTLFIKIWEKRNDLEISTSMKGYLYKSVKNLSLNYLRDNKTGVDIETVIAAEKSEAVVFECEYIELKHQINNSIDLLPDKCKEIFLLSRKEKLTYKQIAEKLNISQKTVEAQIGIALKKLREKLKHIIGLIIFLDFFKN